MHEMKELRGEKEDILDKNRDHEKTINEQERMVQKTKQEKIELLEELKQVNRREEETQINTAKREEGLMSEMDDYKHQLKSKTKQDRGTDETDNETAGGVGGNAKSAGGEGAEFGGARARKQRAEEPDRGGPGGVHERVDWGEAGD